MGRVAGGFPDVVVKGLLERLVGHYLGMERYHCRESVMESEIVLLERCAHPQSRSRRGARRDADVLR